MTDGRKPSERGIDTSTNDDQSSLVGSKKIIGVAAVVLLSGVVGFGLVSLADSGVDPLGITSDEPTYLVDGEEREVQEIAGNGSEAYPFQISSAADLQYITYEPSAHYEVVDDIDASETAEWNDGAGFVGVDEFGGEIDGNGHEITNLTSTDIGESDPVLIHTLDGDIENLTLGVNLDGEQGESVAVPIEESTISASVSDLTVTGTVGSEETGMAVGVVQDNSGAMSNIHVDADVVSYGTASGIVLENNHQISDLRMSGTVTATSDDGTNAVGVALISTEPIRSVTMDGTVESGYSAAGVVATSESALTDVDVTGDVRGESWQTIGVIGTNHGQMQDISMSGTVEGERSTGIVYVNYGPATDMTMSGEVVGEERASGIVNSVQAGSVERVTMSGSVDANRVGGIAHDMVGGEISHADVSGSLSATNDVAGVVLGAHGEEQIGVSNVIVTAEMSGSDVDPVGMRTDVVDFTHVYWDRDVVGVSTTSTMVSNDHGVTTEELQDEDIDVTGSALDGFPFSVAWDVGGDDEYPRLR